jgi:hypothetical protein
MMILRSTRKAGAIPRCSQARLQSLVRGLRELSKRADDGSVATTSRPLHVRTLVALAALATSLAIALWLAAVPAGALVTTVGSAKVGLQPRSKLLLGSEINENEEHYLEPGKFANSEGNPVVASSKIYAIYWDPTDHYHGDWQHVIDTFFQTMGAASGSFASVFAADEQYTDKANQHALYKSTFQGAYTDTDVYPTSDCTDPDPLEVADLIGPVVAEKHTPVCLTDKQIEGELESFISQHSLPKGMGTVFYLLTPPGVTVCLDSGALASHCSDYKRSVYEHGETEIEKKEKETEEEANFEESFCSYHSDVSPTNPTTGDGNTILYGVVPWIAGGLGDNHLTLKDERTKAYDCQDGGYDPSSKPVEQPEEKKIKGSKELTEISEKSPAEQEKIREAEELEGPHEQEPNQVKCPSPDGGCDTGLADLIINQIAVEQQNIVTDPLLNAWQDPKGNEATDECRDWFATVNIGGGVAAQEFTFAGTLYNQTFGTNTYYLNDAFNLAALKLAYPGIGCVPGIRLEPQFTAPNTVNVNEVVGFDGMESDITLNAGTIFTAYGKAHPLYSTYTWNFGDGTPTVTGEAPGAPSVNSPGATPCAEPWEAPCAASVYHSYQYGGTYQVTLTVTDVGGNTASVTEPITVVGPPPPSPTPTPTPTPTPSNPAPGSSTTGSVTTGSGSGGSTGKAASSPPVVSAVVESKSLKKIKGSGLAVHYTVNEQVAGSLQVLLESSTAKRLGIHGPTATGLAKGTPRSIVIGTAVLVTTKAGNGTVRIKFSSATVARLARTHKLKLMLRVVARNASRQSPQTTTLLSTVVLSA